MTCVIDVQSRPGASVPIANVTRFRPGGGFGEISILSLGASSIEHDSFHWRSTDEAISHDFVTGRERARAPGRKRTFRGIRASRGDGGGGRAVFTKGDEKPGKASGRKIFAANF